MIAKAFAGANRLFNPPYLSVSRRAMVTASTIATRVMVRSIRRPSDPAFSAKQILDAAASFSSGLYWINPDGSGAFQIYADMVTAGGGWTLALNSLHGDPAATTDIISNTGIAGLTTDETRSLAALAIDQNARIRYRVTDTSGSLIFDGYYTGNYHGTLPTAGQWTILGGSITFLNYELGRSWSTASHDVDAWPSGNCAVTYGVPWYYGACMDAIPTVTQGYSASQLPYAPGYNIGDWQIWVKELNTPSPPVDTVPEPATAVLTSVALGGILGLFRQRSFH